MVPSVSGGMIRISAAIAAEWVSSLRKRRDDSVMCSPQADAAAFPP